MPEKITIFEPHFHESQFGPSTIGTGSDDEAAAEATEEETEESGGFGKLKLLVLAAVITAVGIAAYRRFSGDEGFEIEVEEYETEEPPTAD